MRHPQPSRPCKRYTLLQDALAVALGSARRHFGITTEELASLLDLPADLLAEAEERDLPDPACRTLVITLVDEAVTQALGERPPENWRLDPRCLNLEGPHGGGA